MTSDTVLTEGSEAGEATSARRPRRSRTSGAPGAEPRRGRRPQPAGADLVASLTEMVDQLITENRELKRVLARAEQASGGGNLGQASKTLTGLQRRVYRALTTGAAPGRGRRAEAPVAAPRPRRKVTDPEVLERRRQALAKARAARAAKRQQAAGQ